jgi:predicted RNA-binding protein
MCEATVSVIKDGKEESLMDNVVSILPEKEQLILTDLFGKQIFTSAKIKEINLLGHKVVLEEK